MSKMQYIPWVQIIHYPDGSMGVASAPSDIPFNDGDLLDHLVEHGVFFYTEWSDEPEGAHVWTTDVHGTELARGWIAESFSSSQIEAVWHNTLVATHTELHPQHTTDDRFEHDGKSA